MRQLHMVRNALVKIGDTIAGRNSDRRRALARIDRFALERRVFVTSTASWEQSELLATPRRAA